MSLINKLFGAKRNAPELVEDGLWLKGEREGNWLEVLDVVKGTQKLELNVSTCYTDQFENSYCIFRSYNQARTNIAYMGCFIKNGTSDAFYVLVDRTERPTGETLRVDSWSDSRQMSEENTKGVSEVVARVKTMAAFNAYSTAPPFVLILAVSGLGRR